MGNPVVVFLMLGENDSIWNKQDALNVETLHQNPEEYHLQIVNLLLSYFFSGKNSTKQQKRVKTYKIRQIYLSLFQFGKYFFMFYKLNVAQFFESVIKKIKSIKNQISKAQ